MVHVLLHRWRQRGGHNLIGVVVKLNRCSVCSTNPGCMISTMRSLSLSSLSNGIQKDASCWMSGTAGRSAATEIGKMNSARVSAPVRWSTSITSFSVLPCSGRNVTKNSLELGKITAIAGDKERATLLLKMFKPLNQNSHESRFSATATKFMSGRVSLNTQDHCPIKTHPFRRFTMHTAYSILYPICSMVLVYLPTCGWFCSGKYW